MILDKERIRDPSQLHTIEAVNRQGVTMRCNPPLLERAVREAKPDIAAIVRPYGVGIDCHSKFIACCALVLCRGEIHRYEREFATTWKGLLAARLFLVDSIREAGVHVGELHYVLESTACYHMPVIHAFGGRASVVNPLLAGPYRRKTDKLDARTLAYHGMTGLWPASRRLSHVRLPRSTAVRLLPGKGLSPAVRPAGVAVGSFTGNVTETEAVVGWVGSW